MLSSTLSHGLSTKNRPNNFTNEMTLSLEFSVPYDVAVTHIVYHPCKQGRRFFKTGENLVTLTYDLHSYYFEEC